MVTKPKNRVFSALILACRNFSQDFIDLIQLKTLGCYVKRVGTRGSAVDLDGFHDRLDLTGAALSGPRRLEMVADNIGGHYLQEPINGIFMLGPERCQQVAIVLAKFQVGILDQVIQLRPRRFTPVPGGS